MDTITRKDAKAQGLKTYFTGKPCKRNHIDYRRVSSGQCCLCSRELALEWSRLNPEKCLKNAKNWQKENPERAAHNAKIWRINHPEKASQVSKNYYKNNTEKYSLKGSNYRAQKLRATPKWANFEEMYKFFIERKNRTKETGIQHHVHHIVPLNNPIVCGLHNQFNLKVIPAKENLSIGNRWWPDMPD